MNRIDRSRVENFGPLAHRGAMESMVMIREADSFNIGTLRTLPTPVGGAAAPALTPTIGAVRHSLESAEQEITRLTWSVLDGSASLSDRQRLAELVNAQHAVRRRIDR